MALNIHKILANTLLDLCREKKLESITVKNILEETGISRQTFYNRFRDKNDLIQWTYENVILIEFRKNEETGSYYENTLNYCRALEKYRFFMKQAYRLEGQNNLRESIFKYASDYDYQWHLKHYKNGENGKLPDNFKFLSHYHSVAAVYLEMEWVCSDDTNRLTPEEMARLITEARKISLSDKYFGKNNPIYEYPED